MIRFTLLACLAFALGGCLSIPDGVFACDDGNCPDGFRCLPTSEGSRCFEDTNGDQTWPCQGVGNIRLDQLCDEFTDCLDGSDETKCKWRLCATGGISIRTAQFCDGVIDCADESDENDCSPAQCLDAAGTTVPFAWLCDGDIDCPGYSLDPSRRIDEDQCMRCDTGSELVHSFAYCDNVIDCTDGSDELECFYCDPEKTEPLPKWTLCDWNLDCDGGWDEFFCADDLSCDGGGTMVPSLWVCDGFPDCEDGADEDALTTCLRIGIEEWPPTLTCGFDTVVAWQLCNGVTDCSDGSDEYRANCPFTCLDGTRIPREWVCDGVPNCTNGDDEAYLGEGDPPRWNDVCGGVSLPG
jgi:low-density lipoprotein receptor-related protein 1 (alpha-2-macroglobulin receptor)